MSLPFLENIGLTKKEADIYELLLHLGETPVGEIINQSKLKRATVYKVLYSLEKKTLVSHRDIEKKIRFRPESPNQLASLISKRFQNLERAQDTFNTLLPQLASEYILTVEKPVVTTFEGVEGLKKIYEDTLKEGKEIYAVLKTEEADPVLLEWLNHTYVKKRSKAKIPAKVILASGKYVAQYTKRDKKELRTTVVVPSKDFPFRHEIDIYADKVAFINYRKGEALIGIIIKHPSIAQTMRAWFDLAWKGATVQAEQ
ncbi:hypothetical protein FJY90_06520 [Candidatus Gottesmanbacteria bacterium]|nr:hypothetical protein [Candidatus Gottesmanbacteria bacterium]